MKTNPQRVRPSLPILQRHQIVSIDDKINFIKQEITKNALHTDSHFDDTTQINFSNKDGLKTLSHETEITLEGQKMATLTELVINENDELDLYVTALNKRNPVSKDIDSYDTSIDKYYKILKDREPIPLQSPQRLLPPQEDGEELRELKKFFIDLSIKYRLYGYNKTQEILTSQFYDCTIAYDDIGKTIIEFTDSSIRLDKKHYKISIDNNGQFTFEYLFGKEGSVYKSAEKEDNKDKIITLLTKIKETIERFEGINEFKYYSLIDNHETKSVDEKGVEFVSHSLLEDSELRSFDEKRVEFVSHSLLEDSELRSFDEESNDPNKSDDTEVAGGDFYARRAFFAKKAVKGEIPLPKSPFISTTPKPKAPSHKDIGLKETGPRENESQQKIQPVREISQQAHQGIFDTDNSKIQQNTDSTLSSQDIIKKDEILPVPDLSGPSVSQSTFTLKVTQGNYLQTFQKNEDTCYTNGNATATQQSEERSSGQAHHNPNQEILSGIFVYEDNVDSPERSTGQALSGQPGLRGGHSLTPLHPTTRNFQTQTRRSCFTGILARCFGGQQGRG